MHSAVFLLSMISSFMFCWVSQHHGWSFLSLPGFLSLLVWQKLSRLVNEWCWPPTTAESWRNQWGSCGIWSLPNGTVEGQWYVHDNHYCSSCSSIVGWSPLFHVSYYVVGSGVSFNMISRSAPKSIQVDLNCHCREVLNTYEEFWSETLLLESSPPHFSLLSFLFLFWISPFLVLVLFLFLFLLLLLLLLLFFWCFPFSCCFVFSLSFRFSRTSSTMAKIFHSYWCC